MNRFLIHALKLLLVTLLVSVPHVGAQEAGRGAPNGLILTWQQDPLTTMTVDWHVMSGEGPQTLFYRVAGETRWLEAETPAGRPFPHLDGARIYRVELTGLEPGTLYEFRLAEGGRTYQFRTMPQDLREPLRFVAGGDVRHTQAMMEKTAKAVMPYDPDFIIWGGDLAYADGRPDRVDRWVEFLNAMMRTLVTPEGRVIPVIAGIGNHEVRGAYYYNIEDYRPGPEWQLEYAPFYYDLFAFPGHPGYGVLDFADYLSIIPLDSDHTSPIEGAQTEWLDETLAARTAVPHVFPFYHVGGFPAVRDPAGQVHTRVREHWVPLFERHGVQVVFENHDHVYKRTFPIRNGAIHPQGVIYIGDGAWGVNTREVGRSHPREAWYLDRALPDRHGIVVTLHGPHRHILVVNEDGQVIDEIPEAPSRP